MPELPDLQVITKNLNKLYANCVLTNVSLASKAKTNATQEEYRKLLLGKKIKDITRVGKEIKILFETHDYIMLHLMREGNLHNDIKNEKNFIVKLEFDNNTLLAMSDYMWQAKCLLNPPITEVPDPFSVSFTMDYFKSRLYEKKRTSIKSFLIDQSNILGIGNAYADEILWETKLSPFTKCGNIPEEVIADLYENIIQVLDISVKRIMEISPDIISGEIRSFMNVHDKSKTESPTGFEIFSEKIGGKITYYTKEQILYE